VVELLRAGPSTQRASVFVVPHGARITPYADRVFHLEDGQLTQQERTDELPRSSVT
jgi:ABC-type lipoprotein export system ATPase subunit